MVLYGTYKFRVGYLYSLLSLLNLKSELVPSGPKIPSQKEAGLISQT
jgi:hypothetical protein